MDDKTKITPKDRNLFSLHGNTVSQARGSLRAECLLAFSCCNHGFLFILHPPPVLFLNRGGPCPWPRLLRLAASHPAGEGWNNPPRSKAQNRDHLGEPRYFHLISSHQNGGPPISSHLISSHVIDWDSHLLLGIRSALWTNFTMPCLMSEVYPAVPPPTKFRWPFQGN